MPLPQQRGCHTKSAHIAQHTIHAPQRHRSCGAHSDNPRYGSHTCHASRARIMRYATSVVCALAIACACVPAIAQPIQSASQVQAIQTMDMQHIAKVKTTVSLAGKKRIKILKRSIRMQSMNDDSAFYFSQSQGGRCTAASVAMMLRRAAFLDGKSDYLSIDENSVVANAWTSCGLLNSFTCAGYQVSFGSLGDSHANTLQKLLKAHPEGIAAYDPYVPHCILIVDYKDGIFYAADPAGSYSGRKVALADTYNGTVRGSQESVLAGLCTCWLITN